MSRLDDIIARNQRALGGDHGIVKAIGKLASRPEEPRPPDLPGLRRRAATSPVLVVAVMLGLGAVIGFFTYRGMQAEAEHDRKTQQQP